MFVSCTIIPQAYRLCYKALHFSHCSISHMPTKPLAFSKLWVRQSLGLWLEGLGLWLSLHVKTSVHKITYMVRGYTEQWTSICVHSRACTLWHGDVTMYRQVSCPGHPVLIMAATSAGLFGESSYREFLLSVTCLGSCVWDTGFFLC